LTASGGSVTTTSVTAGGNVTATASQDVTLPLIAAGGAVTANAGGTVTATSLTAAGDIGLTGGTGVQGGTWTSTGGSVTALATTGPVTVTTINASTDVGLTASGGSVTATSITAGNNVDALASQDVTIQTIIAGGKVTAKAGHNATLGSVTAPAVSVSAPTSTTTIVSASDTIIPNLNVGTATIILAGTGGLVITNGFVSESLTVTTPYISQIVVDALYPLITNADVKIFTNGGAFSLGVHGLTVSTSTFVIQRDSQIETIAVGGTDVTVPYFTWSENAKALVVTIPTPTIPPVPDVQGALGFVGIPVSVQGLDQPGDGNPAGLQP